MNRILSIILITLPLLAHSQSAYQHVSDRHLYQFLDELAGIHVIDLTTAIKPYSRTDIANYLEQAEENRMQLTPARRAQLDQYLREFAMERGELKKGRWNLLQRDSTLSVHLLLPEVAYRDSLFTALIRPVYGFRHFSGGNQDFWATYGGAEAISYIGSNWSVYASLRDNYQSASAFHNPPGSHRNPAEPTKDKPAAAGAASSAKCAAA